MKIAIIGTGRVGSTLAYAAVLKQFCSHLVIASRTPDKALGDALDLEHALTFCSKPMHIEACRIEEVGRADVVVVTASVPSIPNFTSRLQLGEGNAAIFRRLIPLLAANNPDALLLIVSNPVDVMTFAATRLSGFAPQRVMGVGTLVDSARFRAMLSREEHVHPDDLRTYVLGEHGPNQFAVLAHAQVGGEPIRATPAHKLLLKQVTEAGFEVYRHKGYTNYAIATATCLVLEAIAFDEYRTMPLATCFGEWEGIRDNCFSIPVVVGRLGIVRHLHPKFSPQERQELQSAAGVVRAGIERLLPDLI